MDADRRFSQIETCRQFSSTNSDQHFENSNNRQYSPLISEQSFAQSDSGIQFSSINNGTQFGPSNNNNRQFPLTNNQSFQSDYEARQFHSINTNQQFSNAEQDANFTQVEKQYSQLNVDESFHPLKTSDHFNASSHFNTSLPVQNQFTTVVPNKDYSISNTRHFQTSSTKQFSQVAPERQYSNSELGTTLHSVETNSHFQSIESDAQFPSIENEQFSTDIRNYCTTELIDEETNNGPLDFSLHRAQDLNVKMEIVPIEENASTHVKQKAPRVKLTLRETPEQREKRLKEGRERMRRLRSNETLEEREVRLQKARECQERRRQRERVTESTEERERRLAIARERTRLRRAHESNNQRERRLKATRDRLRIKRACESHEERQRRLQRMRERKHGKHSEDKEFVRRRIRRIKTDEDVERRQTRGISIKYDAFDDEFDEALFQVAYAGCTIPWVTEPEVCLSVDSAQNTLRESLSAAQPSNSLKEEATVPAAHTLQNKISQHVSNLVLKSDDLPVTVKEPLSPKSHKEKLKNYYKEKYPSTELRIDASSPPGASNHPPNPTFSQIGDQDEVLCKSKEEASSIERRNLTTLEPSDPSNMFKTESGDIYEDFPANDSPHLGTEDLLPPVTEGAPNVFPQQGGPDSPLNLNQKAYQYQRYTPPPPYKPPSNGNQSYGIYCLPPMENGKNFDIRNNKETSDDNAK